jgi:hypothetical protein
MINNNTFTRKISNTCLQYMNMHILLVQLQLLFSYHHQTYKFAQWPFMYFKYLSTLKCTYVFAHSRCFLFATHKFCRHFWAVYESQNKDTKKSCPSLPGRTKEQITLNSIYL